MVVVTAGVAMLLATSPIGVAVGGSGSSGGVGVDNGVGTMTIRVGAAVGEAFDAPMVLVGSRPQAEARALAAIAVALRSTWRRVTKRPGRSPAIGSSFVSAKHLRAHGQSTGSTWRTAGDQEAVHRQMFDPKRLHAV
jgi:hypothetical protein